MPEVTRTVVSLHGKVYTRTKFTTWISKPHIKSFFFVCYTLWWHCSWTMPKLFLRRVMSIFNFKILCFCDISFPKKNILNSFNLLNCSKSKCPYILFIDILVLLRRTIQNIPLNLDLLLNISDLILPVLWKLSCLKLIHKLGQFLSYLFKVFTLYFK